MFGVGLFQCDCSTLSLRFLRGLCLFFKRDVNLLSHLLWKCFCSLIFSLTTPVLQIISLLTLSFDPLTSSFQVFMIDILHFASSGGESTTYQAYASLLNWIEYWEHSMLHISNHIERSVLLYPKVRSHRPCLLIIYWERTCLAMCFNIGVFGMLHFSRVIYGW